MTPDRTDRMAQPPVWPLLCSAALLALGMATQEIRFRRQRNERASPARTGAFGTLRSSDEPAVLQLHRAQEPGRGRRATSPWQIPWQGWRDILWRTYQQIGEDRLLPVAAGVTFYGLLALFPALAAIVSLYGLFGDPSTIGAHLAAARGVLPDSAIAIVQDQLHKLAAKSGAKLSFDFVLGLVIALWSANSGMKAIIDALNVVYEEQEKRGFIRLNLLSVSFTLAAMAALLLILALIIVLPFVLTKLGLQSVTAILFQVARWPLLLTLVIIGLALIYRYGPSRREPRWQWLSVGSSFAAITWLVSSTLLSWYLANFANYNATYGSLGAAVGMMMWMWVSAIVILVGAQLNSEIEHQTGRDSTVDGKKPLGARGAVMADTVGRAKN